MELRNKIRSILDFPKEGIDFKDITTLLKDKEGFKQAVDQICKHLENEKVDYVVAPEARGFILGSAVAYKLNAGFIPVRKKGKLPGEVYTVGYDLEYGKDYLEIHKDAIEEGKNIVLVDDLIATGGTSLAIIELLENIKANIVSLEYLIELEFLNPREKLKGYKVNSLIKYEN